MGIGGVRVKKGEGERESVKKKEKVYLIRTNILFSERSFIIILF